MIKWTKWTGKEEVEPGILYLVCNAFCHFAYPSLLHEKTWINEKGDRLYNISHFTPINVPRRRKREL